MDTIYQLLTNLSCKLPEVLVRGVAILVPILFIIAVYP